MNPIFLIKDMEINYNLISLIDVLGLIQGITLGTVLLLINKKESKSTLFLGIFIIAYALDLIPSILGDLHISQYYPEYELIILGVGWLLFPLFYIYVQEISILRKRKYSYRVLMPGIVVSIIGVFMSFFNLETKLIFLESGWYLATMLSGIIYSLLIGVLTIKYIEQHLLELKNQYSSTDYKGLVWAKRFILTGIILTLISLLSVFVETNFYFQLVMTIINIVLLYWISIRGILQQNVAGLLSAENEINRTENTNLKNEKSNSIQTKNIEELLNKLEEYVKRNEIFSKSDLTIVHVAEYLNEHPKRISGIINTHLNQNFNSYVNGFRIEKAKELLKSEFSNSYSIAGIGEEVGFQSKSSFYEAFKKSTNTTPLKYKNN